MSSVDLLPIGDASIRWRRYDETSPAWTGFDHNNQIAGYVARYDRDGHRYWMGFLLGNNLPGRPHFDTADQAMAAVEAADHVRPF